MAMPIPSPIYREIPYPEEALALFRREGAAPRFPWRPPSPPSPVRLVEHAPPSAGPVFFLGDVHGDLLALLGVLAAIRSLAPGGGRVVFLGDVVDRGTDSLACLQRISSCLSYPPFPVTFLLGDHEEALSWEREGGRLRSSVSHANFAEESMGLPGVREWGPALVEWLQGQPRALFLPQGLFAAHGGVPQQDLLPLLNSPQSLELPQVQQDFLWNRLTDARRKRPGRFGRGTEFGRENLREFCQAAGGFLEERPRLLLCGHQHPFPGWQWIVADEAEGMAALCLATTFQRVPVPGESPWGVPCFARYLPPAPGERATGKDLAVFGMRPPGGGAEGPAEAGRACP